MSWSDRRLSLVLGVLFLATFALSFTESLEVIVDEPASPTAAVTVAGGALLLFGSVAFVVAGLTRRLTVAGRTLEWWQIQSVGYGAIGSYLVVSGLVSIASLLGVATLVAGVSFIAFGALRLRTDPSTEPTAEAP
ncbi:hypothetical protein [Halopiger aswanensis]|uniref:Integral membrane protein n=1 Tax=Halopiger aswanensis TaxID=148449 RepID=A0A419WSL9_9EURY|nr:hypothetical protein [Halopiger aswanensis]RKD98396.1 hypothetical protein ATJ93_1403 [Halopiger aswanensis]